LAQAMKLQVFEQFHGGHHTNYIMALLPDLARLVKESIIEEAIVTITERHLETLQQIYNCEEVCECVKFDTALPEVAPNVSLRGRMQIAAQVIQAVERNKPTHFLSTSADYESLFLAARNCLKLRSTPKDLFSLGILHYGYAGRSLTFAERVKQAVYMNAWKHANWSRMLMVNPLMYEALQQSGESVSRRIGMLPDPVPSSVRFDKEAARKALGIPSDGRYVGFIGQMDPRKAICELASAWKAADLGAKDYLLLAGRLHPAYRKFVENECHEQIKCGRVIIMDKQLSEAEMFAGYCALDVVAVLQYRRPNLSANMLKAIAARRPVIVDDYGYTGLIARRFKVGVACDIMNHGDLVATIVKALDESAHYVSGSDAERLIQYHDPRNFVNTCLHSLEGLLPPGYGEPIKTWQWACDGGAEA
jgi:glycosyltransferase involved in cell wall biosynthesis